MNSANALMKLSNNDALVRCCQSSTQVFRFQHHPDSVCLCVCAFHQPRLFTATFRCHKLNRIVRLHQKAMLEGRVEKMIKAWTACNHASSSDGLGPATDGNYLIASYPPRSWLEPMSAIQINE